jgi:phospholipid transport system substrate-binding protein
MDAKSDGRDATSIVLRRLGIGFSAVMLAAVLVAHPAVAATPKEEIQSAIEKVVAILKDPKLKSEAKKQERLEQLRQVIFPKFDFTEMAKRSLGANWQRRSPEEQREFAKIFTQMIEGSYIDNLDSYNGEKVTVTGEKQDQGFAQVSTKIVANNGEEFSVDYKLYQSGNDWKVYDVVIENVSIVNNYRSQFNRVIARSSFEDLMRRMKDKQFEAVGKKQKS